MSAREKTFREELDTLIEEGEKLYQAIQEECASNNSDKTTSGFRDNYQQWYSLTIEIVRHTLPNRLADFKNHYTYPTERKNLNLDNYRIDDYCNKRQNFRENNYIIPFKTAIPHFQQQLNILKAAKEMLSSRLLDLKALIQADLFDSEIDAAKELAKKGFLRPAGVICRVIIEKHLHALCYKHKIEIDNKKPAIADFNDALKKEKIITVDTWRFIQCNNDICVICCHEKEQKPTDKNLTDLINGTNTIIKTVY